MNRIIQRKIIDLSRTQSQVATLIQKSFRRRIIHIGVVHEIGVWFIIFIQ